MDESVEAPAMTRITPDIWSPLGADRVVAWGAIMRAVRRGWRQPSVRKVDTSGTASDSHWGSSGPYGNRRSAFPGQVIDAGVRCGDLCSEGRLPGPVSPCEGRTANAARHCSSDAHQVRAWLPPLVDESMKHQPIGEPSRLQIVIDTSVLRQAKGNLSLGDWPILRAAARLGLFHLRLPAVVLQEVVDHRRRDLLQLMDMERKVARLRGELLGRVPSETPQPADNSSLNEARVQDVCADYANQVRAWFEEVGSVLDHPSVPHNELVARVLARRRPFNESERGYRDALIWYSTLECADSGSVILLSANTKDFGRAHGSSYELADDLAADLEALGLPPDRVSLTTTMSALLRAVIPEWDDAGVEAAWSAYISSEAGVSALDQFLDAQMGRELTTPPPDAPPWLWSIGLRSLDAVTSVDDIQIVPESDGWYRVHARVSCTGRLGGYAWAWGDSNADVGDFVVWDDWGGHTLFYATDSSKSADVVVAARFRPLVEVEELDIATVTLPEVPEREGQVDELTRVGRSLRALLEMLNLHGDRPDFLADVLDANDSEFQMVVSQVVAEWEAIADAVPGRFPALSIDNLGTVLQDAAGLRALRRDLELVTVALDRVLANGP